jgi:hypothetical protein
MAKFIPPFSLLFGGNSCSYSFSVSRLACGVDSGETHVIRILYICILSHIAISLSLSLFLSVTSRQGNNEEQTHTRNKGTNDHDWKETAIFLETSINT